MTTDIALDRSTGDLIATVSNDVMILSGQGVIEQRIRTRLKIVLGTWLLDPTGGNLGSTLTSLVRLPAFRVIEELPLVVKEALAPMSDISVDDVSVFADETDPRVVNYTISYTLTGDEGDSDGATFVGVLGVN